MLYYYCFVHVHVRTKLTVETAVQPSKSLFAKLLGIAGKCDASTTKCVLTKQYSIGSHGLMSASSPK